MYKYNTKMYYTQHGHSILHYLIWKYVCVDFILNDSDKNIKSNIDIGDTNSLNDTNRYT